MSSIPFTNVEFCLLPLAERVAKANRWLDENPDHEQRGWVQLQLGVAAKLAVFAKVEKFSLKGVLEMYPACTINREPNFPDRHDHADVIDNLIDESSFSQTNALMDHDFLEATFYYNERYNDPYLPYPIDLVLNVVQSVIDGLKLTKRIGAVPLRFLAGVPCQVMLFCESESPFFFRHPFAVLEVNTPGNCAEHRRLVFSGKKKVDGEMVENRVAGSNFAQMMALKMFGFKKVYGMITNGHHWRLTSTDSFNCDHDLSSFGPHSAKAIVDKLNGLLNQDCAGQVTKESPETTGLESETHDSAPETRHQIYASQIVPDLMLDVVDSEKLLPTIQASGQKILGLVTIFILKACETLCDLLEDRDPSLTAPIAMYPNMPCRRLTPKVQDTFVFETVHFKEGLKLDGYITKNEDIAVFHHLGTGGSASCFLGGASSNGGNSCCCAVKFYFSGWKIPHSCILAKAEQKNWQRVYGKQTVLPVARVLKVVEGSCLVMPYLHPVEGRDQQQSLLEGG